MSHVLHIQQSLYEVGTEINMLEIAMPQYCLCFGDTFDLNTHECGVPRSDIPVDYGIGHLGKEHFRKTRNRVTQRID